MKSVAVAVAALLAASPALAELAVTAPVTGTVCRGGERCIIEWSDNGSEPSLAEQGACTVALYTGNRIGQTFLQPIAFPTPINVSTTARIEFIVDPTIGENADAYFIRFSSVDLRNPDSPTNPFLSFSAHFTLEGMTGTFNATVQDQIDGLTASTSSTRSSTSTGTGTTTRAGSSTGSSSSSTATNTDQADAAMSLKQSVPAAVGAVLAGLFAMWF